MDIDPGDASLMPGWIDTHVHVCVALRRARPVGEWRSDCAGTCARNAGKRPGDGGKAVDDGRVEHAIAEEAGGIEREAHQSILQALDIDVPPVVIGGVRYVRVGRCEAPYHTLAGSVSIERSLNRQSGQRGGQPGARVVDPVSLRAGVVDDGWLPRTAQAMDAPGAAGDLARAGTA